MGVIDDKKNHVILLTILIVLSLGYLNNYNINQKIAGENTENIILEENAVNLDSLSLKQKIAQMIMVRGDNEQLKYNNLNVGGIFLDRQLSEESYKEIIQKYQEDSTIKLLVSTDLEGAWTPFRNNPEPHQIFPDFSNIMDSEEAYEVGLKHGELLNSIGFNINFAPVAEYSDMVYGGRTFTGSKKEISEKVESYIQGLQKNVFGTCKHYPGNSMERNLHLVSDEQIISEDDLLLFDICLENNISAIMVSHHIARGELDSGGKPSSVSNEIISTIDDSALIIADEINMLGLQNFYNDDKIALYIDLINSGNNLILDFHLTPVSVYELLNDLEKEVINGNIDESQIDNSVKKILRLKGYEFQ